MDGLVQTFLHILIGLAEDEAIAEIKTSGFVARIVDRDGVPFLHTTDCRTDRINLGIVKGKVAKADIG